MKTVQTLLGTLVKRSPYYMTMLMKPNNYEEVFLMNQQWMGMLQFTKMPGRIEDPFQHYVSSIITILDRHTEYEERLEYFLIPSETTPAIMHPTWKKNKKRIKPESIPPEFFKKIAEKDRSDIMYSSSPH